MERVAVFIDGSNLYHSLKAALGFANIDFTYLAEKIVTKKRKLVRVYYYNAPVDPKEVPDQYKEQQKFFDKISNLPYFELKLGTLVRRKHGMVEKGVDVKLATDMVAFASKDIYDTAVLISADGDFADAVQHVKDLGKHVELAFPQGGKLYRLRKVCDKFILLDKSYIRSL